MDYNSHLHVTDFSSSGCFFAALFQSLLYEACGRTVNPVFGAVGLLWAGNWQVCQAAVETVLKGGSLKAPSPCSLTSSSLPQGPFHLSNPGKDFPAAAVSRGARESLLPSITTVVKEDTTTNNKNKNDNTHDLCKARVGIEGANPFQRANGYESKDVAAAAVALVKSSWDQKWDAMQQQQEWSLKPQQQQQQHLQLPQELQPGAAAKGNVTVNSNAIFWPEALGTTKVAHNKVGEKRERDFTMGAVVAPAPRRVKPYSALDREYLGMYGHGVSVVKDQKFLFDDQETVVGSTEHLDLGLTLMVKDGKGGQITGLKRVYSPSCDSVNSEGSVTSLDTTPRHGHHASFSSQMNFGGPDMAGPNRRLLPLLL